MESSVVCHLGLLDIGTVSDCIDPIKTPHLKVLIYLQGSILR